MKAKMARLRLSINCGRILLRLFHQNITASRSRPVPKRRIHYPSYPARSKLFGQQKANIIPSQKYSSDTPKKGKFEDALQSNSMVLIGSITAGFILSVLWIFYAVLCACPEAIVRMVIRYHMYKSGMTEKFVHVGDRTYCYGEKNEPKPDKPTIVFLHGFTSSKNQWLSAFRGLKTDSHLIAMEFPGHGYSSAPDKNQVLDVKFIQATIMEFLDAVGLSEKKVHLCGLSLGGAMVGIFSALHPERVEKVTMVCPAMSTPVESDFLRSLKETMKKNPDEIKYSDCLLLPQDIEGLQHMFDKCVYRKDTLAMHPQIYQGLLNTRLPRSAFFLRLFKATNTDENLNLLAKLAPYITMPSQIIWGKHDEILDVSGAEYLREKLPNCRFLDVLERCGHAVDNDRPDALCRNIEKFILLEQ